MKLVEKSGSVMIPRQRILCPGACIRLGLVGLIMNKDKLFQSSAIPFIKCYYIELFHHKLIQ